MIFSSLYLCLFNIYEAKGDKPHPVVPITWQMVNEANADSQSPLPCELGDGPGAGHSVSPADI